MNKVFPWSVTWIHAGPVAVSTTGPWAAPGGAVGCCIGRFGATAAVGGGVAAVGPGCSSARWLSRVMTRISTMMAATAETTSHLGIVREFGLPCVVAVNRRPGDTDAEVALVRELPVDHGRVRVEHAWVGERAGERQLLALLPNPTV